MKKIILCLLLVAALALAFAACGKGGDDPQGDDTTVATTEATTEATVLPFPLQGQRAVAMRAVTPVTG